MTKKLKDKDKDKTLGKMICEIYNGDEEIRTEKSSNHFLKAIAIGIKYLVKNSK
jgi:hypothetical protein